MLEIYFDLTSRHKHMICILVQGTISKTMVRLFFSRTSQVLNSFSLSLNVWVFLFFHLGDKKERMDEQGPRKPPPSWGNILQFQNLDRRIIWSSETSSDGFGGSYIVKCSFGLCFASFDRVAGSDGRSRHGGRRSEKMKKKTLRKDSRRRDCPSLRRKRRRRRRWFDRKKKIGRVRERRGDSRRAQKRIHWN